MKPLFISDLHLDAATRPDKVQLFLQLLQAAPQRAGALYILGDLFEVWAGDDDPTAPGIIDALAQATRQGLNIHFMCGNRDLLVGRRFAQQTGVTRLPDPTVLELHGTRILLMHGDTLCTSDYAYQGYRYIANLRLVQSAFLALPLRLRQRATRGLRKGMRRPGRIVDVEPRAVLRALRRHQACTLIHGHTHLQGSHILTLDGVPAARYVLGDWYHQDCILEWQSGAPRFYRVAEWLAH